MNVTRIIDPTDECGLCRAHMIDYIITWTWADNTREGRLEACHACVVRYARSEIRYAVAALVMREMEKGEFEDDRPKSIAEE